MIIRRKYIFIAAFAVLSALAAYFIINIRFQTKYSGVIEGNSSSQIIIERSEFGCPLVHVENREDMFYALGFLHAQDRLPLMEYFRMLADDSISFDDDESISELKKIIRRTGLKHFAAVYSDNISDTSKFLLSSYVKGINNYKNKFSYKKTAPNDYLKQDWTNEDVIALFYLLEFSGRFINYRELSVAMPEEKKLWADELFGKDNSVIYTETDSKFVRGFRKISERLEKAIGNYGEGFVYFSSVNSEKNYGLKLMSSSAIYPLWYPVSFEMKGNKYYAVTVASLPFAFHFSGKDFHSVFPARTDYFSISKIMLTETDDSYISSDKKYVFSKIRKSTGAPYAAVSDQGFIALADDFGIDGVSHSTDITDETSDDAAEEYYFISNSFPKNTYIDFLFDITAGENEIDFKASLSSAESYPSVMLASDADEVKEYNYGFSFADYSEKTIIKKKNVQPVNCFSERKLSSSGFASGDIFYNPVKRNYSAVNSLRYENIFNSIREGMTRDDMLAFSKIDKSASIEFFLPLFLKKLDNVQITSAKLARIYLSGWNASFDSVSVVPSIYEGVYLNFLNEAFSDEFGDVFFSAYDKGYLPAEFLRDIADKGVSPFFDDILTPETREDRDKIFDRAFLKTIRIMHRKFGPKMEDWNLEKFSSNNASGEASAPSLRRLYVSGDSSSINACYYKYNKNDSLFNVSYYTSLNAVLGKDFLVSANFPFSIGYFRKFARPRRGEFSEVKAFSEDNKLVINPEIK